MNLAFAEDPQFKYVPEGIRIGVERAALYEGQAQAMAVNYSSRHDIRKVAIWKAEYETWQQRKNDLLANTSLQKDKLSQHAAAIVCASFEMNIHQEA